MPPLGLELMKPVIKKEEGGQGLAAMHTGPYDAMHEKIELLMKASRDLEVFQAGPFIATFLNDPATVKSPAELKTEIVLPIMIAGSPPSKLPDGITLKKIESAEVASIAARGAYGKADVAALTQLCGWVGTSGYEQIGMPRILYHHDQSTTVEEDLISEAQVPVRKK